MTSRAFSLIEIKSFDEEERILTGIATTPSPDRVLDVVEPLGGKFVLPLPLLLDHDRLAQVGHVFEARATREGIAFKARIAKIEEPGPLKDLVDMAWQAVKHKLRAAVSIGFRALPGGAERLDSGGTRFKLWEWLELSLCTIPAHAEALILTSKSIDATTMAALKSIDTKWKPPAETEPARKPHTVVRLDGTRPEPAKPVTPTSEPTTEWGWKVAQIDAEIARIKTLHHEAQRQFEIENTKAAPHFSISATDDWYHKAEKYEQRLRELRSVRDKLETEGDLGNIEWGEPEEWRRRKVRAAPAPVQNPAPAAAASDDRKWHDIDDNLKEPPDPYGLRTNLAENQEKIDAAFEQFGDFYINHQRKFWKDAGANPDMLVALETFAIAIGTLDGVVQWYAHRHVEAEQRIAALEQQFAAAAGPLKQLADRIEAGEGRFMAWKGVWHPDLSYKAGHCVTWAGSAWHADRASKGTKPDTIGEEKAWSLVVKRGRDGRDAK
ncbi:hypothetical protein [Mesorhizobium sp. CN2-181]|uniref:hypothetical protein n=1 Tax=Mesorhizobium yinganensis TaxID=3157707 RepID=UPI0032B81269